MKKFPKKFPKTTKNCYMVLVLVLEKVLVLE